MKPELKFLTITEQDIEILKTVKSLLEQNYFQPSEQQLMLAVSLIKSSEMWKNNKMKNYWMVFNHLYLNNIRSLPYFKKYCWNVSNLFKPSRLNQNYVVSRAVKFINTALSNQYFIYESKN